MVFHLHNAEPVEAITSPKNCTTLHYNYLVKCLNLVLVLEDTGLCFTATQWLKSPSRMFIPGIPFKFLKHRSLPLSSLSSPSPTHPTLFFLSTRHNWVHPSSLSLTYLTPTFPFLTHKPTFSQPNIISPHSAN